MVILKQPSMRELWGTLGSLRGSDWEEAKLVSGKCLYDFPVDYFYGCRLVVHKETGDILGVGGIDHLGGAAAPWLLLTRNVQRHTVEFVRWSKDYCERLLKIYGKLTNRVDIQNAAHVRYLRFLGADIEGKGRIQTFIIKRKEDDALRE